MEAVARAAEHAGREEVLRERIGDARVGVAAELALGGLVAELVADLGERQLGADVEAFLEAEVAAVAIVGRTDL